MLGKLEAGETIVTETGNLHAEGKAEKPWRTPWTLPPYPPPTSGSSGRIMPMYEVRTWKGSAGRRIQQRRRLTISVGLTAREDLTVVEKLTVDRATRGD